MDQQDNSHTVQKFGYRFSRLPVSLEIQLFSLDEPGLFLARAACNDISEVGLGAELEQPLNPGTEVLVVLPGIAPFEALKLRAQVTHCVDKHCGFRFIFASEEEQASLTAYMSHFSRKVFPV